MKFIRNAMATAKTMPRSVWVASLIVPGGITLLGSYILVKGVYKSFRRKTTEEVLKDLVQSMDKKAYEEMPNVQGQVLPLESLQAVLKEKMKND